jgi:RNA polymerase sigma-70 factor, ECF subfamily
MAQAATTPEDPKLRERFERDVLPLLPSLYSAAMRLTRNRSDAEDLVQETYLRALAHRDQYTPGTNCRAWLFTICRNVFVKGAMRDARAPTKP